MEEIDILILNKVNIDALERLKSEAELYFDELILSENIIIGKANTFFQILIVILVSIVGFIISEMPKIDMYSYIIQASIIFSIFLFISILILIRIIYPQKTKLKGSIPTSMLKADIFDSSEFEIENFLSNRVLCLDKDIREKQSNQLKLSKLLKLAVWITLIGLITIIIYSCIRLFL